MGAGVAGLRAAIELADHGKVLVVTRESLSESNTRYAQGGIAVATEDDADVAPHLEDTIKAGDGRGRSYRRDGPHFITPMIWRFVKSVAIRLHQ